MLTKMTVTNYDKEIDRQWSLVDQSQDLWHKTFLPILKLARAPTIQILLFLFKLFELWTSPSGTELRISTTIFKTLFLFSKKLLGILDKFCY